LDQRLAVLPGVGADERREVCRSASGDVLLPETSQFTLESLDEAVIEIAHRTLPTADRRATAVEASIARCSSPTTVRALRIRLVLASR